MTSFISSCAGKVLGPAELLFSQPMSRTEVLLGKILGLFASRAIAVIFGFGVSGFIVAAQSGADRHVNERLEGKDSMNLLVLRDRLF